MVTIDSPYRKAGTWLRGNLHTHTTVSDGTRSPANTIADYAARGYDFLAVSDHSWTASEAGTVFEIDDSRDDTDLLLVPAVEESGQRGAGSRPHVLHLGATRPVEPDVGTDLRAVVDAVRERGGVPVAAHPNWTAGFDAWTDEQLRAVDCAGVEVYNGLVENHPGSALATDKWDRLLSEGRRVWGFANDDAHRASQVGRGWNVVQVDERTPTAILEALAAGRFYASTGVTIRDVRTSDGQITVETADAGRIRLVSDHGLVQQVVDCPTATFRVPHHLVHGTAHSYVRVECVGARGAMAWTQPLFLAD